jgi:hypothetical protein
LTDSKWKFSIIWANILAWILFYFLHDFEPRLLGTIRSES